MLATPSEGEVHSWTLIPPAYTLSRSVEVLLSIGQTIYVVDATESEDRLLDIGPFTHISVSPNGRFVALYTEAGKAYVITSDFQNRLSEHDSKAKTLPMDVQWCGNDAVVIAWEDEVHVIGPNDAAAKYFYDGRVHVIAGMLLNLSSIILKNTSLHEMCYESMLIRSRSRRSKTHYQRCL